VGGWEVGLEGSGDVGFEHSSAEVEDGHDDGIMLCYSCADDFDVS
jgi:hypothetical protein